MIPLWHVDNPQDFTPSQLGDLSRVHFDLSIYRILKITEYNLENTLLYCQREFDEIEGHISAFMRDAARNGKIAQPRRKRFSFAKP